MKTRTLSFAVLIAALLIFNACGGTATNSNTNVTVNTNANMNSAGSTAAAETEIKHLMDTAQTALAKNDADAMDKIYADNYMLVNLDGSVQTRAERLESLRSDDTKYTAFAYDEPNIRVNPEGNGAVAIARITMKGTSKGKPIDGTFRVTQVYSRTKDGWRQVSAQATAITGGATMPTTMTGSSTAANTNKMATTAHANTSMTANSNSPMMKTANSNTNK
ncbi:MAG: nuclear transport factor 2 family protein [Pyrinomonadaceae bacterium]